MNMKDILSKLDATLGPKTVPMTKAQFETYVKEQIAKAKDEEKDDAEKAKKRLSALRDVVSHVVAKGSWEGAAGTALNIPVYDEGYEKPTTMPTEESGNMQGGGETMGAGSGGNFSSNGVPAAAGGGAAAGGEGGPSMLGGGETMGPGSGGNFSSNGVTKAIADLEKMVGELAAPAKEKTEKAAPASAFAWPNDLSNDEYLKTGIAKNAPEWGLDPKAE